MALFPGSHNACTEQAVLGEIRMSGTRAGLLGFRSKGIGVRVLASLAGHRSIAVTQRYIDVNDAMKRNAVELV